MSPLTTHTSPLSLMDMVEVVEENREPFLALLTLLRYHHEPTYQHGLRVGNLAATMAQFAKLPDVSPNLMVYAGLLHDVGKCVIPVSLLSKTGIFTEDDYLIMENHPMYGFLMLQGIFEFTAQVIVRHHRYGTRPYPSLLPALPAYMAHEEKTIEAAARLLALADYYDALTTRDNDRNVGQTVAEKRERYHRDNPGQEALIEHLEAAGVLTYM